MICTGRPVESWQRGLCQQPVGWDSLAVHLSNETFRGEDGATSGHAIGHRWRIPIRWLNVKRTVIFTRYPAMACQLTTSFWWFIFQHGTWPRNWQSDTIVSVQYPVWQDWTPGEEPLAADPSERMLTRAVISSSGLSPADRHALHAVLLVCFLASLNSQKGATPTFPPSLRSQRPVWVCVCVCLCCSLLFCQ